MENKKVEEIKKFVRKTKVEHPFHSIDTAMEVAQKIHENGNSLKKEALSIILKKKGGAFEGRLTSARRYGLIEGTDVLKITDTAEKILNPIEDGEDIGLKIRTILSIHLFNKIYSIYGNSLPNKDNFASILLRQYQIPKKSIEGTIRVIKQNLKELPDLGNLKENPHNLLKYSENKENVTPQSEQKSNIKVFEKGRFVVQVISPFDNYTKEVTDEIDWDVIEAVIKGMKNKWIKQHEEKLQKDLN